MVYWVVVPCRFNSGYQCFGRSCYLHLHSPREWGTNMVGYMGRKQNPGQAHENGAQVMWGFKISLLRAIRFPLQEDTEK